MLQFFKVAVCAFLISYQIRSTQSGLFDIVKGIEGNGVGDLIKNFLGVANKIANGDIAEDIKKAVGEMFNVKNIIAKLPVGGRPSITDRCCGKYGCFTVDQPFGFEKCRPLMVLPKCQDVLKIKFYLWTRENPVKKDVIDPDDLNTLTNSHFRKTNCVFVFIIGYLGYGDVFFVLDMKNAVLEKDDCMFISVDWKIGAYMDYISSTANVQMVSAVTAYMVQQIMDKYDIGPEVFHLTGLSLGVHAVAGVGKRIKGIGRITAMDPAQPLFEHCDATVRLSNTDALFVHVIHTDGRFFGAGTPAGHLDTYVNGGRSQPACLGIDGCNHLLSTFYFIDTIRAKCPYLAYQCDSMDNFMRGKCANGCGEDNSLCAPLGYRADQWRNHSMVSPVLMFMSIKAKKNFCVYHYYVEINCADDQIRLWRYGRNTDELHINLIGADGQTGFQQAYQNSIRFNSFPNITTLITAENQIGEIRRIILKWFPNKIKLSNGNCQNGNITEPKDTFCCKEKLDDGNVRCLMCPYIVTSIYAKNLETSNSARFAVKNKLLSPNKETSFDKEE